MRPERIAELRALRARTTQAPWRVVRQNDDGDSLIYCGGFPDRGIGVWSTLRPPDTEFVCAIVTDAEDLLDAAEFTPQEPECPEPTYNLTPIFDLALTGEPLPNSDVSEGHVVLLGASTDRPRGLRLLSGRTAAETLPDLEKAVQRLHDAAMTHAFCQLEPTNRWGTLEDAQDAMQTLLDRARSYPTFVWAVH